MISFSSPCEVLQLDQISGSSRSHACVAKITTDKTLQRTERNKTQQALPPPIESFNVSGEPLQ
jgi:hypothetical protein